MVRQRYFAFIDSTMEQSTGVVASWEDDFDEVERRRVALLDPFSRVLWFRVRRFLPIFFSNELDNIGASGLLEAFISTKYTHTA